MFHNFSPNLLAAATHSTAILHYYFYSVSGSSLVSYLVRHCLCLKYEDGEQQQRIKKKVVHKNKSRPHQQTNEWTRGRRRWGRKKLFTRALNINIMIFFPQRFFLLLLNGWRKLSWKRVKIWLILTLCSVSCSIRVELWVWEPIESLWRERKEFRQLMFGWLILRWRWLNVEWKLVRSQTTTTS